MYEDNSLITFNECNVGLYVSTTSDISKLYHTYLCANKEKDYPIEIYSNDVFQYPHMYRHITGDDILNEKQLSPYKQNVLILEKAGDAYDEPIYIYKNAQMGVPSDNYNYVQRFYNYDIAPIPFEPLIFPWNESPISDEFSSYIHDHLTTDLPRHEWLTKYFKPFTGISGGIQILHLDKEKNVYNDVSHSEIITCKYGDYYVVRKTTDRHYNWCYINGVKWPLEYLELTPHSISDLLCQISNGKYGSYKEYSVSKLVAFIYNPLSSDASLIKVAWGTPFDVLNGSHILIYATDEHPPVEDILEFFIRVAGRRANPETLTYDENLDLYTMLNWSNIPLPANSFIDETSETTEMQNIPLLQAAINDVVEFEKKKDADNIKLEEFLEDNHQECEGYQELSDEENEALGKEYRANILEIFNFLESYGFKDPLMDDTNIRSSTNLLTLEMLAYKLDQYKKLLNKFYTTQINNVTPIQFYESGDENARFLGSMIFHLGKPYETFFIDYYVYVNKSNKNIFYYVGTSNTIIRVPYEEALNPLNNAHMVFKLHEYILSQKPSKLNKVSILYTCGLPNTSEPLIVEAKGNIIKNVIRFADIIEE